MNLEHLGINAKNAAYILATSTTAQKNQALANIANELEARVADILQANNKDIESAKAAGLTLAMLDRLKLDEKRIRNMAQDVRKVISLADPIGSEFDGKVLENGLFLCRRREPIGVIGVIYEARPNVTIDIASLCLKTGNASILRGGRETFYSNMALVKIIQTALEKAGLPFESVQYIEDANRELVEKLLRMDDYVDMIIPRGGQNLHKLCKEKSTIPVIIGGFGVSHIYVEQSANLAKALNVIINAKVHRPSACNALDTLLIDKSIASELIAGLAPLLNEHNILLVAEASLMPMLNQVAKKREATTQDFDTEWLDYVLNIKLVDNVQEAIAHMRKHNASHSDAILTNDVKAAEYFINHAGSAAVYLNASTRFTDGAEFGLGAEVAVSTQKLHARGPMGLLELTTYKWVGRADYLTRA